MKRGIHIGPLVGLLVCTALFVTGCAGMGGRRPVWVVNPPADSGDTVFFVAAGSDPTGNTALAERQASDALVSEITKFIGVSVESETTVEAKATLDEYRAQVTETIRERSQALVSGFRVVDRYIERTDAGAVFVYLLGGYEREALEAERARFEELFTERIEAVSRPEAEGERLLAAGEVVRAAESYLEAAAAALTSDIDNAMIRYERVIGGAREALSSLALETVSFPSSNRVNAPFDQPFVVRASNRDGVPLAGVPLLVTYRVSRSGGRLAVRTATGLTDSDGLYRFEHPTPTAAGERELIISLDLDASLDPLAAARGKALDLADSVQDLVNGKRITISYRVASESASIPTITEVSDFELDGSVAERSRTASAIASVLSESGFSVGVAGVGSSTETWKRAIRGEARIVHIEERDGSYLVRVEATVSVIELAGGATVFNAEAGQTVRSRSSEGVAAAFTAIGEALGRELAAGLP